VGHVKVNQVVENLNVGHFNPCLCLDEVFDFVDSIIHGDGHSFVALWDFHGCAFCIAYCTGHSLLSAADHKEACFSLFQNVKPSSEFQATQIADKGSGGVSQSTPKFCFVNS
jgi:hypothetical protein